MMKNLLYFSLLIVTCFSCKNKTHQNAKDSVSTFNLSLPKKIDTVANSKLIVQGVWVPVNYINTIEKTRSPYASRDSVQSVSTLIIDTNQTKRDTIDVGYSLGNHEGGSFKLTLNSGSKSNLIGTLKDYSGSPQFNLGYKIANNDTLLFIQLIDKQIKYPGKTFYKKVLRKQTDPDMTYGLQYMVNSILFSGKYTLTDTIGKKMTVEFKDDGHLIGLLNFKKYYIDTDYTTNEPDDGGTDDITFYLKEDDLRNGLDYTYEIKKDTINIYNDHIKLANRKPVYKLVRANNQ